MKSSTANFQNFDSYKSISTEFNSEKQYSSPLFNLYQKHEDEPDFDCEFLQSISYDNSENTIDLELEEENADDYNDNQWEADIYDPYLESTYY